MRVVASAPGKVILSGEHAVVYGYPALVAAQDKRFQITFEGESPDIFQPEQLAKYSSLKEFFEAWQALGQTQTLQIQSRIPIGRGMGSSAAFSVAAAAILQRLQGENYSLDDISRQAYQLEVLQHGKPSGVDNTIATFGGFLWYRREVPDFAVFRSVEPARPLGSLFVVDSGKPRESTKDMVLAVAERREQQPEKYEAVFREIETVTRGFLGWMQGQSGDILELIRTNHRLLVEIGVVSESAQALVTQIEEIGGAAKITGAGGQAKGSGYLVAYHPDEEKMIQLLNELELKYHPLQLGAEGVSIHETN